MGGLAANLNQNTIEFLPYFSMPMLISISTTPSSTESFNNKYLTARAVVKDEAHTFQTML